MSDMSEPHPAWHWRRIQSTLRLLGLHLHLGIVKLSPACSIKDSKYAFDKQTTLTALPCPEMHHMPYLIVSPDRCMACGHAVQGDSRRWPGKALVLGLVGIGALAAGESCAQSPFPLSRMIRHCIERRLHHRAMDYC